MIRPATEKDFEKILLLYRETAQKTGGLARLENEITPEYIQNFMKRSFENGLSLAK